MKPSCPLVGTMTRVINHKAPEQLNWANDQVHDEYELEHIEDAKSHNAELWFRDVIWYFTTSLMSLPLVDHRCSVLANDSETNNDITSPIVA